MNNTVTEETFIDELVQEVKDEICHPANAGKVCVAVEGDDDISLYGKFLNSQLVYFSPTGVCLFIVPILEQLPEYNSQLIGIKDADFDYLRGVNYTLPNLFLTDTHDAETMMLQRSIINDIVYEYTHQQMPNIVNDAFGALEWYSYLQYYNTEIITSVNNDGIRFKGLSISKLFDGSTPICCADCLDIVKHYADNQRLMHFPTEVQLQSFKSQKATTEMFNLHRGHDVTRCIGIMIRCHTYPKGKMIGDDDIPRQLRIRYLFTDFQTTHLYEKLDSWGRAHGYTMWN
jgi:hypothetical protein